MRRLSENAEKKRKRGMVEERRRAKSWLGVVELVKSDLVTIT